MKLRETAIVQESLQAAYSFFEIITSGRHLWPPATPLLYARYLFKEFNKLIHQLFML